MHIVTLQASTNQRFVSPYPGLDRSISGLTQVTHGKLIPSPLQAADFLLSLWILWNYPRHLDKLPGPLFETYVTTPKSRNMLYPLGFRFFLLPVKGSFQLSLMVLIFYRSQLVFKVWSWCLQNSCLISKKQYSRYLFLLSNKFTRLSLSMVLLFRRILFV